MGWGWALIRGWALIKFFCLQDGRLFEVGANSRLGAYSNKYGITHRIIWSSLTFLNTLKKFVSHIKCSVELLFTLSWYIFLTIWAL